MRRFDYLRSPFWRWGIGIGIAGVLISRLLAPSLDPGLQVRLRAAGNVVAFSGLFVIAVGIKRRIDAENRIIPSDPTLPPAP